MFRVKKFISFKLFSNKTMSGPFSARLTYKQAQRKRAWGESQKARFEKMAMGKRASRALAVQRMRMPPVPAYNTGTRGELKCWDNEIGDWPMVLVQDVAGNATNTLAAGMACCNIITQGSAVKERVGNKINMTSIRIRFVIAPTALPLATDNTVRYMLIYDRQTNGAWPAITEILRQNDATTQHLTGINIANRDRFAILREGTIDVDIAKQHMQTVDLYVKCHLQTQYRQSTAGNAAIGDIATGAVYFICFAALLSGPLMPGIYNFASRVRYVD